MQDPLRSRDLRSLARLCGSSVTGVSILALALLACKQTKTDQKDTPPPPAPLAQPAVTVPAAPAEFSFVNVVPKPGTKTNVSRNISTRFTMAGKVYRESEVLSAVSEVQASDEFRVTKASLDFKEYYTLKQEGAGDERKSVNPLAGSRYIVTRNDNGKLSALDGSGSPAPASQVAIIQSEFADAFEKNQDGAFLPARPVKIGEKLVPAGDSVMKMLSIKDDGTTTFDGIEFILASGSAEKSTFTVTMTMTKKLGAGLRLRAKLNGEIDMKPQGEWLLRVDLKGPLEVIDGTGTTKATGDLTAVMSETYTN